MTTPIQVFVVDDHPVVREGILSLIQESQNIQILGEAGNGQSAIQQIETSSIKPDVVLMDINMPVMDGIHCTSYLNKTYKGQIKVLVLTVVKQSLHIRKMLQAGAMGYILKNCDKQELYHAIEQVHLGQSYFSQAVSTVVMNDMVKTGTSIPPKGLELSKREKEVLNLIVQDLTNQEIANRLYISKRTVESHKQNLMSKAGTNNIAGLVVFAIKNKLVDIS
ncbi:MAG: response regulator transcription factor [Bacteroidota bacterium]